MRVLITGVAGNIGKPLCVYLKQQGHEVYGVDILPGYSDTYMQGDINNPQEIDVAFELFKPQICLHAAALYGRIANERYANLSIQTNVAGTNNIIQLCKRYNCNMVFFSSSEIYGNKTGVMSESDFNLHPNNRYGISKMMGEMLMKYEMAEHGLKGLILRMNMAITPTEDFGEYRSAMIRFCESLVKGEKIEVYKGSMRSWCHINDIVIYIGNLMGHSFPSPVNVAHPEQVDIYDVALYICGQLNIDPKKHLLIRPLPKRMTMNKALRLDLLESFGKHTPQYSWRDIVDQTLESVKKRLEI